MSAVFVSKNYNSLLAFGKCLHVNGVIFVPCTNVVSLGLHFPVGNRDYVAEWIVRVT